MAKFSFAHLMGGKKTPAQSAQPGADQSADDSDEKDKTEEEKEEDAEDEEQAAAPAAKPAASQPSGAALDAAVAAAVAGERDRCAAIFAAPAAAHNMALAAELAFNTDLAAARAVEILGKAPKAGKDRLSEAMNRAGSPKLGGGAVDEPRADAGANWDKAVARVNERRGVNAR